MTRPYRSTSALPLPSFRSVSLPPCCPCGEETGLNAEGRCPACERANRILQARLECPVGMCTPAARCSACTDS